MRATSRLRAITLAGLEDDAHAAAAQLAEDLVTAQGRRRLRRLALGKQAGGIWVRFITRGIWVRFITRGIRVRFVTRGMRIGGRLAEG